MEFLQLRLRFREVLQDFACYHGGTWCMVSHQL